MITTKQCFELFGKPGDWENFVKIELPFPMRIAWDTNTVVTHQWCHKKIAEPLTRALQAILDHYGINRIKELGIDLLGGLINVRKMRGGTDWSKHSWGIAIDLDPNRNSLKTKWKNAQFSKPEYNVMMDCFYENGFINLGKEKGYDAMHFEYVIDNGQKSVSKTQA